MRIKSGLTKYDLYQILSAKAELAYYFPPAGVFNDFEELLKFVKSHEKVILKPVDESEGRGICILEQQGENFKITDCRRKKQIKLTLSGVEELKNFFKDTENKFNKFIFQKLIKSPKIEQSFFDVRVVMEKHIHGDWRCIELEYSIGKDKFLLTNVYKELYQTSLSEAIKKTYPLKFDFLKVVKQIKKLCASTSEIIGDILEYDDDIEFEVAIDEDNKPWFVAINLVQCMKKFKVVDYFTYEPGKGTKLLYSTTLYEFGNI